MVRYPQLETPGDTRASFPEEVLHLALERSGSNYLRHRQSLPMTQERMLAMLRSGREIDVMWTITTRERERLLRPVRIPIDRGLFGWRVLLVKRGAAPLFADIRTPADFGGVLCAQGHDWPDTRLLRANGIAVAGTTSYTGLFTMLQRRHVDCVPRSVLEVGAELRRPDAQGLEVEPHLLLRYPSALYFFVHPDNAALAEAIGSGMERARRDGSLDALFERRHAAALAALRLNRRRVIALENPDLPPETPLGRSDFWALPRASR